MSKNTAGGMRQLGAGILTGAVFFFILHLSLFTPDLRAEAKKVAGGIEFSFKNATAKSVHVAGDFNSWAENQEGKVSSPNFLMQKGSDGVWRKTIKVGGGKHTFKYVVNGSEWVSDPSVKEMDKDGNSVFMAEGPAAAPATAMSGSAEMAPKETASGVKFSYKGSAKKVSVAGQFNKWNMDANVMTEEKPGVWSVVIPMPAGSYLYKFVKDGEWILDASNPTKGQDGGIENSLVKVAKGVAPAPSASAAGPKKMKAGFEFSFRAPTAKSVHIAGDFNNWAENNNGSVTNPQYMMNKGSDGIWRKTIPLSAGKHTYKFIMDGSNWTPDPNNAEPRDKDDNSVLTVDAKDAMSGAPASSGGGAAAGPKKVSGGYEFSFRAPTAKTIHLAGDFNNWGDNSSGAVSSEQHLMQKSSDGVWRKTVPISAGKHTYKFVIDGNNWTPDPANSGPRDKDDNSQFTAE